MTKKDYIVIARAIKETKEYLNSCYIYGDNPVITEDQERVYDFSTFIIDKLVINLIEGLKYDNIKFNEQKFYDSVRVARPVYKIINN